MNPVLETDLFGQAVKEPAKHIMKGFASFPGGGPAGETCGSCGHCYSITYRKAYWKCDLVKATRGPGTDIRKKSPACRFWETISTIENL